MHKIIIFFFIVFTTISFAQEQQIANDYFRKGEYEKASVLYESLYTQNNFNSSYLSRLIYCLQQIEDFDKSKYLIDQHLFKYPNQIQFNVELGYNYQLQHQEEKAIELYDKTIDALNNSPAYGYSIARAFHKNHLLDYALQAYEIAMAKNPNANYDIQVANIYGEKGEIEKMFNAYLNLVDKDERYGTTILRYIGNFITDDGESEYNILFKRLVLKRLQANQKNAWNQLLSWLFIQQGQYNNAFIQEKALYKRTDTIGLNGIVNIGELAFENKAYSESKKVFSFVSETTTNEIELLDAKLYLLYIEIETSDDIDFIETQFQNIFNEYGKTATTIDIQLSYADFLTYKKNQSEEALNILKEALAIRSNSFQKNAIKIKIGDVLVFKGQFNQALIYYSQVQSSLKNHILGQEAQFKVAQTSFYKGDFEWAETQLKVLKKSTSQLISNDALKLSLIINDNTVQDSLKVALKLYAQADLLAFQNKNDQAIEILNTILIEHKGHAIEDEALFKQAEIYEKLNQLENAENNYLKVIEINSEDILADDATFQLAEIYFKLNNVEKAKEYYQKIIFDFPSSIHLVDARKKYRQLRGDDIQ